MKFWMDGIAPAAPRAMRQPMVPSRRRPAPMPVQSMNRILTMDGIVVQPARRVRPTAPASAAVMGNSLPTQAAPRFRVPWLPLGVATSAVLALVAGGVWGNAYLGSKTVVKTASVASTVAQPVQTQTVAAPDPIAAVTPILAGFSPANGVSSGLEVINLKTGTVAGAGQDQVFTSASLYKLFVAQAVYRGIDAGSIQPNTMVDGTSTNVTNCLKLMIVISDNSCGQALGSLVGWDRQIPILRTEGFTHTLLRASDTEETSAGDVALLLKRLYEGTLLSPNSTTSLLDLLKAQQINNRLPVELPAGTVVAHKTGDLDGFVHDVGIVYGPSNDYVIAVLTGPWNAPGDAPAKISDLSAKVYAAMQPK